MEVIFKVLVAGIAAVFLVTGGVSVVLSNADETKANQYVESVSKTILESNYDNTVIAECIQNASDNGYTLSVTVVGSSQAGKMQYAKLKLTYTYSLNLFSFSKQKTISKIV